MRNINMGDPSQLISMMAKIDYDEGTQGGGLWVTDGLVVCNTQQDYNEGVNPLCLQWKDQFCSFFPTAKKNAEGFVIANLRLDESLEFITVDEQCIPLTDACYYQT